MLVTMVFVRLGTTFTNLQTTLEPLYNFAAERVKIARRIACRIAKGDLSSTFAMAQLHELRDGGTSWLRGRRIAHRKKASVNPA